MDRIAQLARDGNANFDQVVGQVAAFDELIADIKAKKITPMWEEADISLLNISTRVRHYN